MFRLRCTYVSIHEIQYVPSWVLHDVGTDDTDVIVEIEIHRMHVHCAVCTSFLWLKTEMHSIARKECHVTSVHGQPTEMRMSSTSMSACDVRVSAWRATTKKCEPPDKLRMLQQPLNKLIQRISTFLLLLRSAYTNWPHICFRLTLRRLDARHNCINIFINKPNVLWKMKTQINGISGTHSHSRDVFNVI